MFQKILWDETVFKYNTSVVIPKFIVSSTLSFYSELTIFKICN